MTGFNPIIFSSSTRVTPGSPRFAACFVAGAGWLASVASAAPTPTPSPSSHREAPGITGTPKVDATDFYMFNSYEAGREGFVTIIANYQPFQTPYGGPNFFQMDPEALYQINIDNDGDAKPDITFTFRFTNSLSDLRIPVGGLSQSVPLYNIGGVGPAPTDTGALNIKESFTVGVTQKVGRSRKSDQSANVSAGGRSFIKPADAVGAKSLGDYETYARNHIHTFSIPRTNLTGRVFVGQRKDSFVANLGEIFDLVNLDPVGAPNGKSDSLADSNVTSIVIEVPVAFLRGAADNIVGGWTTASLPQNRSLRNFPTFLAPSFEGGAFVQVSRLGMPLVNELVVGIRDKNRFNASIPRNDPQFLSYVTNPTLPELLKIIFGVTPPTLPRNDLVSVYLTGVEGLNKPANVSPGEMLRLNTNTAATGLKVKGTQNRLGVLGGDLAGFPNGRRPGDDVVDISLRAVMGALYPDAGQVNGNAPSGSLPLTDGAFIDDQAFDAVFPYLRAPITSSPNTVPAPG